MFMCSITSKAIFARHGFSVVYARSRSEPEKKLASENDVNLRV